jgi:polysaccharide transporter, PST family
MNRKLWENLISLYGVQLLTYVVPLVTLPFLARVLGPIRWGELAFAESYAIYISLIIEYGFTLSASRQIAQDPENTSIRSRQLAGVVGAQIVLAVLSLLGTAALSVNHSILGAYRGLLAWAYLLAVARACTPIWYFQGLQRMRFVALMNVTANLLATGAIFLFVRSPDDTWMPLVFRAAAALLALIAGFIVAYRETPFQRPNISLSKRTLREGASLFMFNGAVSLYSSANVLLMGLLAPPSSVALFAGAEKIAKASIGIMNPITQTFYPRITYLLKHDPRQAMGTAKMSLCMTLGAGCLACAFFFLGAPILVRLLLGPQFIQSVLVLRILAFLSPAMAIAFVLGVQWMVPLRMDWTYLRIMLFAGTLNVLLAVVLVPRYQAIGMAVSAVSAEMVVALSIVFTLAQRRLDPWHTLPQELVSDAA